MAGEFYCTFKKLTVTYVLAGYAIVQIHLILQVIPPSSLNIPALDQFLLYVQHFNMSQLDHITGMYPMKHSFCTCELCFGDIILVMQIRMPVHVTPHFNEQADRRLMKAMVMVYSMDFWLNTYFDKESFYILCFLE